jgi:hypothetical protein
MRKEIASSVETAECSFTGMRTRLRRRLPDQRDAGMEIELEEEPGVRIWVAARLLQGEQKRIHFKGLEPEVPPTDLGRGRIVGV